MLEAAAATAPAVVVTLEACCESSTRKLLKTEVHGVLWNASTTGAQMLGYGSARVQTQPKDGSGAAAVGLEELPTGAEDVVVDVAVAVTEVLVVGVTWASTSSTLKSVVAQTNNTSE